jgi:hypothetical protein
MVTDGTPQEVAVTMDASPAYLRGGHIMARRDRARRSTAAMAADPITLVCHSLPTSAVHAQCELFCCALGLSQQQPK